MVTGQALCFPGECNMVGHTNRIQPACVSTLEPMDLNALEFIANVKSHIAANVQLAYTARTVSFQSVEGLASGHCCRH